MMFVPQIIMAAGQTALAPVAIINITPTKSEDNFIAIYFFVISMAGYTLGPTSVALLTDYVFQDESLIRYSISIVALIVGMLVCFSGFKCIPHYLNIFQRCKQVILPSQPRA
ncbi:MAG: hypothetical protein Ct9H300mP4_18190 [Gammaproteobacteria bacterium]|nr:MAG: hypothetical protein Ct9H300mP4_18190 [Gammaproteobacteria bacterium]